MNLASSSLKKKDDRFQIDNSGERMKMILES